MRRILAAVLLALAVVAGAHAAGSGSISGTVVAIPLDVSLTVSPSEISAGASATATATVRNLGAAPLDVTVTLRADPSLTIGDATQTISLAALGSAQVTWSVCSGAGPAGFVLVAIVRSAAFTDESAAQVLNVTSGSPTCPKSVSATLVAGQTLTTDTEGNGATATDPFETAVTTPNAGFASISESTTSIAADAFSFLGWQVQISAPAATTASPLVLVFRLDASIVPAGKLYVFRNGVALTDCPGDPCVSQRSTLTDGDAELVARTSSASQWTFARAILSRGAAAGTFTTSNGISVALTAGCDGTTLAGSLNAGNYRARQMTAFSVSGKKAWLAGVGMDGRTFIAYMEDNAPGGRGDVFKLWIGGVAQTTDGAIKKGDLTVRSL